MSGDKGLALVVALVITLLVFLLTTAILADAFHNVVGSASSRQRLTAINAAEAGVAWFSENLQIATVASLTSGSWSGGPTYTREGSVVAGLPGNGHYRLEVTYYRGFAGGVLSDPVSLGTLTDATIPTVLWAQVDSIGTATVRDSDGVERPAGLPRKVRAVMELYPAHASVAGAYAGIFICELGNRFTIAGPNADLYLLGSTGGGGCPEDSLMVTSGQFTTSGSVFVVNGSALLSNTSLITGDLWAKGPISLGSGATGGGSGGRAGSCAASGSGSVLVCGDVTSVSSEPVLNGTARVLGTVGQCSGCVLPDLTFPKVVWDATAWPSATWGTPVSSWLDSYLPDRAAAVSTSRRVVHITSCTGPLTMPTGTRYLAADLAVVSDCGFAFRGRFLIRNASATRPHLYLITAWPASWAWPPTTTSSSCPDTTRDVSLENQFNASAVDMFIYTPCVLLFRNNVNITGQLSSRTLLAQGNTTINTTEAAGLGSAQPGYVSGFQSRVLNIREI